MNENQQEHEIVELAKQVKRDAQMMDYFINQYMDFIKSEISMNAYQTSPLQNSDEFSIGLLALYEAIQSYESVRQPFLLFAKQVIAFFNWFVYLLGLQKKLHGSHIFRKLWYHLDCSYTHHCHAIIAIITNIVLSLGMVGALSIVRFRIAIKEPLDIAFLFWSIASGIVIAAGLLPIAVFGPLFNGLILIAFSNQKQVDTLYILMV